MKRIIDQLNRKLPELLKEKNQANHNPNDYRPKAETTAYHATLQAQPTTKKELWNPETLQTKGVSQAIKWRMENLPEMTVAIEEVVKLAYEEQGLERSIETAIWRLIQQGQIYQPKLGKIRKL